LSCLTLFNHAVCGCMCLSHCTCQYKHIDLHANTRTRWPAVQIHPHVNIHTSAASFFFWRTSDIPWSPGRCWFWTAFFSSGVLADIKSHHVLMLLMMLISFVISKSSLVESLAWNLFSQIHLYSWSWCCVYKMETTREAWERNTERHTYELEGYIEEMYPLDALVAAQEFKKREAWSVCVGRGWRGGNKSTTKRWVYDDRFRCA